MIHPLPGPGIFLLPSSDDAGGGEGLYAGVSQRRVSTIAAWGTTDNDRDLAVPVRQTGCPRGPTNGRRLRATPGLAYSG